MKIAQEQIKKAQEHYAKYDSKGKKDLDLKVGDQVLVSTKYLVPDQIAARQAQSETPTKIHGPIHSHSSCDPSQLPTGHPF